MSEDLDEKLSSVPLPADMDFTKPYVLSELNKDMVILQYVDRQATCHFLQYHITNINGVYVATPQGALLKK